MPRHLFSTQSMNRVWLTRPRDRLGSFFSLHNDSLSFRNCLIPTLRRRSSWNIPSSSPSSLYVINMEAGLPLLKAMLPKVPLIGKTAIYHTLGFSEHSKHWDLRTELVINVLRSFIVDSPPEPVSRVQKLSLRDPGSRGSYGLAGLKCRGLKKTILDKLYSRS
jgi:hypothetical protein